MSLNKFVLQTLNMIIGNLIKFVDRMQYKATWPFICIIDHDPAYFKI